MNIPFKRGNILLPKNTDMTKWSIVACDQYTSEPEYWKDVEKIVGDAPTTLKLTLPEIYLEDENVSERIAKINSNMKALLDEDFFNEYNGSMIYLERTQSDGKIRENAPLELPLIMILIDDDKKQIIENLKNKDSEDDIVYDFDLMKNSGHVKGYLLNEETMSEEEYINNPARYALVELVNLHSPALEFEAINRVIFNTKPEKLLNSLKEYYQINKDGNGQEIEVITNDVDEKQYIENPKSNIAVGSIQIFLDEYLKNNEGKIDYIHGEETTKNLAKQSGNVGFIFEAMPKNELFKTMILDGSLPRKTFSMGHSYDKRYYLESRKIK